MKEEKLVQGGQGRSDAETMESGMIAAIFFAALVGTVVLYGLQFLL